MRGHSEGDDSLKVVPDEDLASYLEADPLPTYEEKLEQAGLLDAAAREDLGRRIELLIDTSIDAALDAEPPTVETALRSVFAVGEISDGESPGGPGGETTCEEESVESVSYIGAIHRALTEEMERDERLILMGQDIGVFEGAFRATRGLYERWPSRVLDTPIAESGTLGAAIGASLLGNPVVVEMQFADFVSCGFNQLVNVAAKLFYRWQTPCPIVVRLPSGGGVNAGPFHSQNPEAWFTHCAGLKVVCPATAADAGALLKAAIRDPNPVIFCEHKYLYRRIKEPLPKTQSVGQIGEASVLRQGRDLTMVAYGAATWICLEAAEELAAEGVEPEVVDLRSLSPFDERTVVDSVRKTGRALIVHEAAFTSGFGGEVAARLADLAFPWLDAPIHRLAFPDCPVPWAKNLEHHLQPSSRKAIDAARELLKF
jgi:2-oxoisovalerate dehydrogenase E1 component beta subunit